MSTPICVCGAEVGSLECNLRGHVAGPRPVAVEKVSMWGGEMDAFEAWTEGMDPEKKAFVRVMLYHSRDGAGSCSGGCPILLGSSFADHQWDEFVALRDR